MPWSLRSKPSAKKTPAEEVKTSAKRPISEVVAASAKKANLEDSKTASFTLKDSSPPCEVTLPNNLTEQQLLSFVPFKDWLEGLQHALSLQANRDHTFYTLPYKLRKINVESAQWFSNDRLGFVKLNAQIENDQDGWLPGAVFLRGGSVAMLMILQPDDVEAGTEEDKHVILTVQPRIAVGSLALAELPAGMLDGTDQFAGAAAQEVEEETGLKVSKDELFNMSEYATSRASTQLWKKQGDSESSSDEEKIRSAMYPSPGACDEFMPLFLYQKRMGRDELNTLRGRLTGLRNEGERITLKLVKLEDLWKEGSRDGKALSALALYEALRREGQLPEPIS